MKVSPSNHHDQETFKYQSPSDLEAYKIGLRQSINPISEEQKRALKMNQGNLIYCSLKQWSQNSPRTGKKMIINQTTKVKEGTKITTQQLNQSEHGVKTDMIRVNSLALDFSIKVLFKI